LYEIDDEVLRALLKISLAKKRKVMHASTLAFVFKPGKIIGRPYSH